MVLSREAGSKVLRMAIELKYVDAKHKNGECNLRNLQFFPLEMSPDVLALKICFFVSDFEF